MTIRWKRILHPTDFSDCSASATEYAHELATKLAADLHLVHVLESHPTTTPAFVMGLAVTSYARESRAAAERALAELLDPQWAAAHTVIHAVLDGSPTTDIVNYARQNEIDLIVLATHGRTGLSHAIMGSVAENVVRTSPCPVLTVRPDAHRFMAP